MSNVFKVRVHWLQPCYSMIWIAGVAPNRSVANFQYEYDTGHRIVPDNYLAVQNRFIYALGDCASMTDPHTGKPYPPTAHHAIDRVT
jgi:NADH:quinone reductase (non-electrogenic)